MNEEEAYTYLSGAGFAPHQAAGIVGNLFQESSMNPNAVNPKSGAYGMAQYLGPRKKQLIQFAKANGASPSDPRTQLDFMVSELNGSESRARDHLLATKTPEEAAQAFRIHYERPGKAEANDPRRINKARQVFENMVGRALTAAIPAAEAGEIDRGAIQWDEPQLDRNAVKWDEDAPSASTLPGWFKDHAPTQSIRSDGLDPGSIREGAALNLESKLVGAQQIGSDIGRAVSGEIGQPYSPYREQVNKKGRELEAKTKDMPLLTSGGYHGIDMLAYGALGVPEGRVARMASNAAIPAALNALRPYENGGDRIGDSLEVGAVGAVLPEMIPYAFKGAERLAGGAKGGIDIARGIVNKRYGAQRELRREVGKEGVELPATFGQSKHNPPPEYAGPILPEFGRVPGIKPTVGMLTDDPAILSLEMNARNRSSADFMQRDIENKKAIVSALLDRGVTRERADQLVAQLNDQTTKLRESAFKKIRNLGGFDAMTQPLEIVINKTRTAPGARVSEKAGVIANKVDKSLAKASDYVDPEDLYQIRKDLNDALTAKGLSTDEMTNAAKGQRRTVKQFTNAIDAGLQKASEGEWLPYLQAHKTGSQFIEGKRALGNIFADLEQANGKLPGEEGLPDIFPKQLRTLDNRYTQKELGSRLEDVLNPHDRGFLTDAVDTLNAIAKARKGAIATDGSTTTPYLVNLVKSAAKAGTGKVGAAISIMDAIGRARGAKYLDEALMDPEKFQQLLNDYHGGKEGLTGMLIKNTIGHVPESIKRAGVEIGRRATRQPSRD